MPQLFDFSNIESSEKVICQTWEEFRDCLANKKFQFNDIDEARKTTYLHVFDDLFLHGYRFLEKKVDDVLSPKTDIVRAARINEGDAVPNFERFIPNSKWVKNHWPIRPKRNWRKQKFRTAKPANNICGILRSLRTFANANTGTKRLPNVSTSNAPSNMRIASARTAFPPLASTPILLRYAASSMSI